jgi:hypothetical protein
MTADLIRDLKKKEAEVDAMKKREEWIKLALSQASRAGFVCSPSNPVEQEDTGLDEDANTADPKVAEMVLKFKQFRAQILVCELYELVGKGLSFV